MMTALSGKRSFCDLNPMITLVTKASMRIHDYNTIKYEYMSYQKDPVASDATPKDNINAIHRHLLCVLAGYINDEYGSHMNNVVCRAWMLVTNYYRCNNVDYKKEEHDYLNGADYNEAWELLELTKSCAGKGILPVDRDILNRYLHFAPEPHISLYKTTAVFKLKESEYTDTKWIVYLQAAMAMLLHIEANAIYELRTTTLSLLTDINEIDLLWYYVSCAYTYYVMATEDQENK